MPGRAVHFALDRNAVAALVAAPSPRHRADILERIEEDWDTAWLCETDKAWPVIDLALAADRERFPHSVLGERRLDAGTQLRVGLLSPAEVKTLAQRLLPVGPPEFASLYHHIDPQPNGHQPAADDLEYTWPWFAALQRFLVLAAEAGRAVLFTVDE